ncbi:MAG TPA: HEAT repeat domain-containing protein [Candidatus Dormibacteraeota bacterium]|nr:HEAT repeat domain-containing protein [Candidatus Dormibacteraeota bacterium]
MKRKWPLLILAVAFLFVLMPFLFWYSTTFRRPLTDEQISAYLADRAHPRKAQHVLSQIADRILSPDPAVRNAAKKWYPHVIELSHSPIEELRVTSAWVMGQDNGSQEFHAALLTMLNDPHPMVRRNAALSLIRFDKDAAGRAVIVAMLEPSRVLSPQSGILSRRLKPGDQVNPGTLLGHIQQGQVRTEIRAQVPGTVDAWVAIDRSRVTAGDPLLALSPSPEIVWEALRALYFMGQPEDLPLAERFIRGNPDMPDSVRQQAALTAHAIRQRQGK